MTRSHVTRHLSLRSRLPVVLVGIIGLSLLFTALASAQPSAVQRPTGPKPTVVLVHGAWADASSWTGVVEAPPARWVHSYRTGQPAARPRI